MLSVKAAGKAKGEYAGMLGWRDDPRRKLQKIIEEPKEKKRQSWASTRRSLPYI